MKTSWFIGLFSIWFILFVLSSIAEQQNLVTSTQISQAQAFMQPTGTDVTPLQSVPIIGQAISLITNVWTYTKAIIEAIFLWFPDVWTGTWIWFYYCFVLPISIGMVISLVMVLRGVHSA